MKGLTPDDLSALFFTNLCDRADEYRSEAMARIEKERDGRYGDEALIARALFLIVAALERIADAVDRK